MGMPMGGLENFILENFSNRPKTAQPGKEVREKGRTRSIDKKVREKGRNL